MAAEKGTIPPNAGKGRAKGVPNKTTALLKDAILKAAQAAGGDGENGMVEYLTSQAKQNPGPFMALLGKVLPMQVVGDPDNPLQTVTRIELVALKAKKRDDDSND